MVLVKKKPNIFLSYFSVKETLVLSFHCTISLKGGFLEVKMTFYYCRKISMFSKGLSHDSCKKFEISFELSFLKKRPWFCG